jgi:hypothetical protein
VTNPRSTIRPFDERIGGKLGGGFSRATRAKKAIVVNHLFECRRGVVVKIGSGLTDPTELRDIQHAEVSRLARGQQSSRIRSGDN